MTANAIVVILLFGITLTGCNSKSATPVLNIAVFSVHDSVTGEAINISMSVDGPQLNELTTITITEMIPGGPYRATWIGTTEEFGVVTLSADGYQNVELPEDAIQSSTGEHFIGGSITPTEVQMHPLE